MRIAERKLRSVIRSVIKENYDYESHKESHKQSIIEKFSKPENHDYWIRQLSRDFYDMSTGGSADIKSMYYYRWEEDDFKQVIEAIEKSLPRAGRL